MTKFENAPASFPGEGLGTFEHRGASLLADKSSGRKMHELLRFRLKTGCVFGQTCTKASAGYGEGILPYALAQLVTGQDFPLLTGVWVPTGVWL